MAAVEETSIGRFGRRARHGIRIATSPRLMREQIEFMRHGPSAGTPPQAVAFPASPWSLPADGRAAHHCNVCGWRGDEFDGDRHVEGQLCPRCGSSARDRFLFHCFVSRTSPTRWLRILETSPPIGVAYRAAMEQWFTYTPTDFDGSAHRGVVQLDLQDPQRRAGSVDVLLSAHVLEHVPDTDRALDGIRRLLAPGGRLYLQVPVLQGTTAPPAEPEFHQDNTPVFWRFGFDLADRLREHGFATAVLCTEPFVELVRTGGDRTDGHEWHDHQWDLPAMVRAAAATNVVSVLGTAAAARLGLWESYQFVTFEGRLPGPATGDRLAIAVRRAVARLR